MTIKKLPGARLMLTLAASFFLAGAAIAATNSSPAAEAPVGENQARVSESRYYARDGRSQAVPDRVSTDEYLPSTDAADKTTRGQQLTKSAVESGKPPNTDFWFYTADVQLFGDEDNDGHFYGIDLLFDADTVYGDAQVYAVLYLSENGGPWFEYAATDVFDIYGATSDDEYVIVSELLQGYPAGSYDILIELFDTYDDSFVADFGPDQSSELSYLPLEDAERDLPNTGGGTVIVNQDGGGASGPASLVVFGLLSLTLLALRRRLPRRA